METHCIKKVQKCLKTKKPTFNKKSGLLTYRNKIGAWMTGFNLDINKAGVLQLQGKG